MPINRIKMDQPWSTPSRTDKHDRHSHTPHVSRQEFRAKQDQTSAKLYVGNLGDDPPSKPLLEQTFGYYGKLEHIWIARNPPGFAYVEFESDKDAKDAARALDGKAMKIGNEDRRIKVELARGLSDRALANAKERDRKKQQGCWGMRGQDHSIRAGGRRSGSRSRSRSRSRDYRSDSRSRSSSPENRRSPVPRNGRSRGYERQRRNDMREERIFSTQRRTDFFNSARQRSGHRDRRNESRSRSRSPAKRPREQRSYSRESSISHKSWGSRSRSRSRSNEPKKKKRVIVIPR